MPPLAGADQEFISFVMALQGGLLPGGGVPTAWVGRVVVRGVIEGEEVDGHGLLERRACPPPLHPTHSSFENAGIRSRSRTNTSTLSCKPCLAALVYSIVDWYSLHPGGTAYSSPGTAVTTLQTLGRWVSPPHMDFCNTHGCRSAPQKTETPFRGVFIHGSLQ